ncbi:MAG TPA: hypothetical protein VJ946_04175 [Bacteroidales bacterium]|nr:hypothetical protein [Bacteroidales bacterium]
MRKKLLLISLFLCLLSVAFCQNKNAIGLRLGMVQAVSYQHYFTHGFSAELIAGFYRWDPVAFAFAQYQPGEFLNNEKLKLIFGLGGHTGQFEGYKNTAWFDSYDDQQVTHFIAGVDILLGINYDFEEFPVNLSFDVRPALNLHPDVVYWSGVALTGRYVF